MNHETAAPVEQRHGKGSSLHETNDFVSVVVGDQLFGIPVLEVRDVLASQRITRVPLAPPEVAGSLNLRGRIVTAIDLRTRLGLPPRAAEQSALQSGGGFGWRGAAPVRGDVRAQSGDARSTVARSLRGHLSARRYTARSLRRYAPARHLHSSGSGLGHDVAFRTNENVGT